MSTTLTSMAILKVNFDRAGKDILDNFVPFFADRVYHLRATALSVPDIKKAIRVEYGISIPGGVLKTVAKKCGRRGLLRQEAGILYPDLDKLADFDLTAVRAETRRKHTALVNLGVRFSREEFDATVDADMFERGLSAFIRDNAAPLLATVVEGYPLVALDRADSTEMKYLIGSFVASLHEAHPEGFEYLAAVVKGALLASALYYSDVTAFSARLDRLFVYADTTLLLRAVGAGGPELQLLAAESIALALKLGAKVYCFRHTMDEIMGVLDACERAVRRGGKLAHGEATEYMLSAGWGQSDVIELKNSFEDRLQIIGVRVREKPGHESHLTLDEARLETLLQDEVRYVNRSALLRDVDSLTAIYRLRGGNEYRQLERCRAIFVTHNGSLVSAARKYMKLEDWERDTIPLAVQDHVLTTLLWLKEPLAAPSLPEHAIVADCFAAMRPDDSLWRRYVDKIDALRDRDSVSEDEYVLLRQSMPVRSLIMYETKQDPDAFTEGTVDRVLSKARENIQREALEEIQVERQRRTEVDVQLELARADALRLRHERDAEAQARRLRMDMFAGKIARGASLALATILAIVALAGTVLTVTWPGNGGLSPSGVSAWVFSLVLLVLSCLSVYGLVWGGSISTATKTFEAWLSRIIAAWIRRVIP